MGSTTTDDSEGREPQATGEGREPTLVLAHAGGRPPERVHIPGAGLLLGRGALVFPGGVLDDHKLSRRHAEVRAVGERVHITDVGSRNGTFVNGDRLGETLLLYARMSGAARAEEVAPALVGPSDGLSDVRRAIATVAGQRRTVLVIGETGTGKEVIAQALHARSGLRGQLLATNCGALAEGVLASELFGHVRGAFTGAVGDRPGLFRSADKGTLLLDEIGEMPLALQAQLLRVLEVGKVCPVGGSQELPVDVTVVAATNRDLVTAVRRSGFRADLYGRLAQWIIHVPPLRDRREDLPWLIPYLVERCGAAGRPLTPALVEALLLHPWPLNVRGLYNVLSIAALASPGPLDLHADVKSALAAERGLIGSGVGTTTTAEPPLADIERALADAHGVVSVAAKRLKASRQQLYRWITKHQIDLEKLRT